MADITRVALLDALCAEFGDYLSPQTISSVLSRQLADRGTTDQTRERARQELSEILSAF